MDIDEHPVPDVVVAAFCRLVDRLDAKRILGTASVMPAIFQGHRVIAQNVPVARQRIKSLLKNDRHLDTYTATLLRGTGLASEFVVVLSEAALQEGFSDLARYFGEADFLAVTGGYFLRHLAILAKSMQAIQAQSRLPKAPNRGLQAVLAYLGGLAARAEAPALAA